MYAPLCSIAYSVSHGWIARSAHAPLDYAHSVGLIDQRTHPIWGPSTPRLWHFVPRFDGTSASAGAKGIYLSRLRTYHSALRHLWHYHAHEGHAEGARGVRSTGSQVATRGCTRSPQRQESTGRGSRLFKLTRFPPVLLDKSNIPVR